jgi:glycosyltransferase involved in cell wall biosynthesis
MNDSTATPPICLTMIVRDEENNIEGCVNSAADYLSALAVVDTGSVDCTESILRNTAARLDVPCFVERAVWTDDFSFHRNESFSLAKKAAGANAIALLLDADERVLAGLKSAVDLSQDADIVSGWLVEGSFRHRKNFLARLTHATGWRGSRHEYMEYADGTRFAHCGKLLVSYGNAGYRRRDSTTHRKDIAELQKMMTNTSSTDHRTAWLYARTLEASGRYGDASDVYARSLAHSRTGDTKYQSAWGVARCEHLLDQRGAFVPSGYKNLVALQPGRAEGWLGLAQVAYEATDYPTAFKHALRAATCSEPLDTVMYDRAGYTWLSREIAARALLECKQTPYEALNLLTEAVEYAPDSEEDLIRINELVAELR